MGVKHRLSYLDRDCSSRMARTSINQGEWVVVCLVIDRRSTPPKDSFEVQISPWRSGTPSVSISSAPRFCAPLSLENPILPVFRNV